MCEEVNRFNLPSIDEISIKVRKGNRKEHVSFLIPHNNLEETKNKLSSINQNTWIKARKNINNYEFPFSSEKLKSKPISRAFFKILEIIKDNNVNLSKNTLHLAEAPGGFIEGVLYYKNKLNIKNTRHYTFSIIGNKKTPIYHKKIVSNKDVFILSNKINKGDLYLSSNISFLINEMSNKHITFITCDGGFAENNEFSSKEQLHHKLIFNQIVCSIFILEEGGSVVLKIFDIFTELTFDILYLLSYLFGEVYIHKPLTSRNTNSEKYIYCNFFKKKLLDKNLQNLLKYLCINDIENYKSFVDKSSINKEFLQKILEVNRILTNKQIKSINNVLDGVMSSPVNIDNWINKYY